MNMFHLLRKAAAPFFAVSVLSFSCLTANAAPIQSGVPLLADPQFQACLDEAVLSNGWMATEEVTALVCPDRDIKVTAGIESFPNLTQLDLSNNKLFDIYPLQVFTQLTQLNLSGNTLLSPFDVKNIIQNNSGLTHLGVADIAMGNFLDWLPPADLQGKFNLLELDISNTDQIYDVYPLMQYNNLRVLKIAGNLLFDVDPIATLAQLEVLDLSNNQLNNIESLQLLNNLRQLNLSNNQSIYGSAWVDMYTVNSIITANPMLTHLGLAGIAIGDLNQLNIFSPTITELDISNTNISDISPLVNLVNLSVLKASGNLIGNMNGLDQLPLRVLELNNNKVTGIGGINLSPSLEILDLSDNKLVDVFQLQFLNQLKRLNLTGNSMLSSVDVSHIVQNNYGLTHIGVGGINMGNLYWLPPVGSQGQYNIQELDISNTGIFSDLQSLMQYSNMQVLKAAGNQIQNSDALGQLVNLSVLDLSNNKLAYLSSLQGLNKLAQLNLAGNSMLQSPEVKSIIQNNPGLTHLNVAGIAMGDYLDWLPQPIFPGEYDFVELDISYTGAVFDMYPLSQYSNLKVLKTAGNQVWDTWQLESLQRLEVLDLSDNILNEVSSLQYLQNLKQLNLSNNKTMSGFPPLDVFAVNPILSANPKLTHLGLAGIAIGDLNQLDIFSILSTSLIELDISNTNISDISPLTSLSNLRVLKANNNLIGDVFGLELLPLQVLELSSNQITNMGQLDQRNQLKELDISDNNLSDAYPLQALYRLTKLNLSGNSMLQSFDVKNIIQNNPDLTHLGVAGIAMGNDLNWLPPMGSQGEYNLLELDISNTGMFFDLQRLAQYNNLKVIKSAGNQLRAVGPLESLQQLEVIDLSNNRLFDVLALEVLNKLTRLNLSGNDLLQRFDVENIINNNPDITHLYINGINMGNDLDWLPAAGPQGEFNLLELGISNTGLIIDLYPLLQQPNLKVLKIAGNQLWDVWPIDQLSQLEVLDLSNNDLVYVVPLGNLLRLTSLDLRENNNIQCSELDALEAQLSVGVLLKPQSCVFFTPPEISILNPLEGSLYFETSNINFIALTNDAEDGNLDALVEWSSNIDGALGTGGILNKSLSAGAHAITAAVTDSHGNTATRSVNLTVLPNMAPQLTIYSIQNGAVFNEGEAVLLAADALDNEDGAISQNIQWTSNVDGFLGAGANLQHVLSVGSHIITASITDSGNANTMQTVSVTINGLPQLTLQTPTTGSLFQQSASVSFTAIASDVEDGDLGASIIWSSNLDGLLGTGINIEKTLSVGSHIITASVSDNSGANITQTVTVNINALPQLTLQSPSTGSVFQQGVSVSFTATSTDVEDGDLGASINWSSSIDGALGTGALLSQVLSLGDHIITASVTDSAGASTTQTVAIRVNAPPSLVLISPASGSLFMLQETVEFSATSSDNEDGNISANIQWSSDVDGALGSGVDISKTLSLGAHILTASITDSNGATLSASTEVVIDQIVLGITVKSRGSRKKAILTWSGSRTDVDIYRNGEVIDTDNASGTENYRFRNQAYFKVCETGTIYCSVEILAE